MKNNLGTIYAISAYTCWGLLPIFWKQLEHVGAIEIVMHRMFWSFLLVIGLVVLMRQWRELIALFRLPAVMFRMFIASLLMAVNWAIFVWAVNVDRIVETSMGYFMNPLITVLCGVLFFSERLRSRQLVAIVVAFVGVVMMVVTHGELPWVSLSLAITFSLYSVIKKTVSMPATHGMAIETAFMFLPATFYLATLSWQQQGVFGAHAQTDFMLILAGLFTLIPLVLFAAAAKQVSLTALGMSQYLSPFLQLVIAVLIYKEPFGADRMLAFGLIWIALAIYTLDQVKHRRRLTA